MKTRSPRRSTSSLCVCFAVLALTVSSAYAGDAAAGRQKALQCQACHGLDGLSKRPDAPNLAGQPEPFLIKALNDFRKGVRQNEMMSIMIKTLSDTDIADLAAYYSAIQITTKPPH
jgi:cytochrome c553